MKHATKTSFLALTAAFLSLSAPANATDINLGDPTASNYVAPTNWTGPYIALGAGYEAFRSEQTETVNDEDCNWWACWNDPVDVVTESFDGNVVVTGRIGYDWQAGATVFGVNAEASWSNISTTLGDLDFSYAVGARAGLLCGNALCYIAGGWEFLELDNASTNNPYLGGGIQADLGGGWGLAPEVRYSFSDDDENGVDVKDRFSGRLFLSKKFH